MSAYALGALVAYRPNWTPPGTVDGWLSTPHTIIAIRTYAHIERPLQVHYTLVPAQGDIADWWHMRPITLVRVDQLRAWPLARCKHCGTELPLVRTTTPVAEGCHDCTVWAVHLHTAAQAEATP